jgi:arylsulfatase A-like enzyme
VDWREVPLPSLYPGSAALAAQMLADKPAHWRGYFDGSLWTNLESPRGFAPMDLTPDQIREINAMNHIENELIDEACGRVLDWLDVRGWSDDTDILFTTDHGELQGDYGLLFKGPYHVDALMRVPLIWRPAPASNPVPAEIAAPVGHLDLAATFCAIAGVDCPDWVEGRPLPLSEGEAERQQRRQMLTEWESEHGPVSIRLTSIYHAEGYLLSMYHPGSLYDGSEGELYDLSEDPEQRINRWDDPALRARQNDLRALLVESLPAARMPRLERRAPV